VKQKLVNFCLEEGGYGENADADQRHQIIKTMIYLEEKTDGETMIVRWCAIAGDIWVIA